MSQGISIYLLLQPVSANKILHRKTWLKGSTSVLQLSYANDSRSFAFDKASISWCFLWLECLVKVDAKVFLKSLACHEVCVQLQTTLEGETRHRVLGIPSQITHSFHHVCSIVTGNYMILLSTDCCIV